MLSNKQRLVLDIFKQKIEKEQFINNQASVYYYKQNNKFVFPGIVITGIASVASFLTTSDSITEDMKKAGAIGVGVLTVGSTIIQSISSSYGFKARAEAFERSADAYGSLLTKIEFEIVNPNEDFNELCNYLESSILKIKSDIKYLPPLFIHQLWEDYKKGIFVEEDPNAIFGVSIEDVKDKAEELVEDETIKRVLEAKEKVEEVIEIGIEANETYQTVKQEHNNTIKKRDNMTTQMQLSYDDTMNGNSSVSAINVDDINSESSSNDI
jgi:hypothetical protein